MSTDESITIRVVNKHLSREEVVMPFKIKKSTPMKKVFNVYKSRIGFGPYGRIDEDAFYFTFNGNRISDEDTSEQIHLEDDGQIDCCLPAEMSAAYETITIRVVNKYLPRDEVVTEFEIRKSSPLKRVFDTCKARSDGGIGMDVFRFTFNGEIISEEDTAQQLQIEDGGQIDCVLPTNSEIVSAKLLDICDSELSLAALQERINSLEPHTIRDAFNEKSHYLYTFFHRACLNKKITSDIMNYLLEIFPEAVSSYVESSPMLTRQPTKAYPLHLACFNKHCPGSVIQLLVKEDPELCKVKGKVHDENNNNMIAPAQLPVHYYLSRNNNVGIDVVKMFVNAEEQGPDYYPIHSLLYNSNIKKMQDILKYLVNAEPSSLHETNNFYGRKPLNIACENEAVNLSIVELLFNSIPEGNRNLIDGHDKHPIHSLCANKKLDDNGSLEILRFMLDIDPTLPQVRDTIKIPIHYAVVGKSTEFCKVLIDSFPESVKVEALFNGLLPLHEACRYGDRVDNVDTIQYLLEIYPESINAPDNEGWTPIHKAAWIGKTKTIELLLKHDPDVASKMTDNENEDEAPIEQLPLHIAIRAVEHRNATGDIINFDSKFKSIKVLYDAYPEAINIRDGDGEAPLDMAREENKEEIVNFLRIQLDYAQQAQDTTAMTTPDEEGYLPIHRALLQGNASLGSIKLLVGGNTAALRVADQKGVLPLHTACRNATANIVKFLVDSYDGLDISNSNQDYPLHYACQVANLDVIKYLMGRSTSRVSAANNDNKLPFYLLIESDNEQVRDSLEFTEACFMLLQAHPEAVKMGTTIGNGEETSIESAE